MKISKLKVVIVFLALFFLVGQSCSTTGIGKKKSNEKGDDFSGTKGIVLNFVEGLPPKEIWKGIEFGVWLDVHNQGVNDVETGSVCISSINENIFTKAINCLPLGKIEGRGKIPNFDGNIGGQVERFGEDDWEGISLKEDYPVNVDTTFPIAAKVCYKYSTTLTPQACIRDLVMDEKDALCNAGEITINKNGQGAPVAVTSLKEDIAPRGDKNELIFTMTIENKDDGEVIKAGSIDSNNDCNFDRKEKDYVNVEVELPGFGKAACRNKGDIVLVNGKGQAFCTGIKVPKGESFPLPLNIKLTYGYLSRARSEFIVKKDILEGE